MCSTSLLTGWATAFNPDTAYSIGGGIVTVYGQVWQAIRTSNTFQPVEAATVDALALKGEVDIHHTAVGTLTLYSPFPEAAGTRLTFVVGMQSTDQDMRRICGFMSGALIIG